MAKKDENQFISVNDLRSWLRKRADEAGSPEAYDKWLRYYYEDGNIVTVNGIEYDYWTCLELL